MKSPGVLKRGKKMNDSIPLDIPVDCRIFHETEQELRYPPRCSEGVRSLMGIFEELNNQLSPQLKRKLHLHFQILRRSGLYHIQDQLFTTLRGLIHDEVSTRTE